MATKPLTMVDTLIDAYLACDIASRDRWLRDHHDDLQIEFIEGIKQRSDALLQKSGIASDVLTTAALHAASMLPQLPLALALAQWARGNWATFNALDQALDFYAMALASYREANDQVAATRILGNMVGVLAEFGRYEEAERYYEEARAIYSSLDTGLSEPRMILEQNYGLILHEWGRYEAALVVHRHAYAMAVHLDHSISCIHTRVNYAFTLERLGRLAEAATLFLDVREAAAQSELWLVVARIDMNLGHLYAHMGNPAEAIRHLHAAYDGFTRQNNQMELGSVTLRLADAYSRIGVLAQAIHLYKQAQRHFLAYAMLPQVGEALLRAARASKHYRSYRQAHHLLDQAEDIWTSLNHALLRILVRLERVSVLLAQQQPAEAFVVLQRIAIPADNPLLNASYTLLSAHIVRLLGVNQSDHRDHTLAHADQAYHQVLTYAVEQNDRWSQRQALIGLGLLWETTNAATSISYLEQAALIEDETLRSLSIEELKSSFQRQSKDIYTPLIRLALHHGDAQTVLHYVWKEKGNGLYELLSATRPAEKTLLDAEIDHIRHALAVRRWEVARHTADDTLEALQERSDPQIQELETQLSRLREKRTIQHLHQSFMPMQSPTDIFNHTSADVLIEYAQHDADLIAIRLDRDGQCMVIPLGTIEDVRQDLDDLTFKFGRVLRDVPAFLRQECPHDPQTYLATLTHLYNRLIRPLGPMPHESHILIAPCSSLYLTPFAALWDGCHYVSDLYRLEMTPCAVLLNAPRLESSYDTKPLLIGASRDGLLPHIGDEITALNTIIPDATVYMNDPADVMALSTIQAPSIVHIGAHTLIRDDAPLFSALDLNGGLLSVEHCSALNLHGTPLITLSGCITTKGWDTGGAILAFPSAFFIAGAACVVSSLWNTYDQAAVQWMTFFYEHYRSVADVPAATHAAQRRMREETLFTHPAFWSAFICSRR